MADEEKKDNNKNKKELSFSENISERHDISEAIVSFLKGKTIQECIDTLDAVKRKLLNRTVA